MGEQNLHQVAKILHADVPHLAQNGPVVEMAAIDPIGTLVADQVNIQQVFTSHRSRFHHRLVGSFTGKQLANGFGDSGTGDVAHSHRAVDDSQADELQLVPGKLARTHRGFHHQVGGSGLGRTNPQCDYPLGIVGGNVTRLRRLGKVFSRPQFRPGVMRRVWARQ